MKHLLLISLLISFWVANGQTTGGQYTPSISTQASAPIGVQGKRPFNAKEWYYDNVNGKWRPFRSYAEATNWLPASQRFPNIHAYIDSTGSLVNGVILEGLQFPADFVYNTSLVLVPAPAGSNTSLTPLTKNTIGDSIVYTLNGTRYAIKDNNGYMGLATDANTAIQNGTYMSAASGNSNYPTDNYYSIQSSRIDNSDNYITQIAKDISGNQFTRTKFGGVWGWWKPIGSAVFHPEDYGPTATANQLQRAINMAATAARGTGGIVQIRKGSTTNVDSTIVLGGVYLDLNGNTLVMTTNNICFVDMSQASLQNFGGIYGGKLRYNTIQTGNVNSIGIRLTKAGRNSFQSVVRNVEIINPYNGIEATAGTYFAYTFDNVGVLTPANKGFYLASDTGLATNIVMLNCWVNSPKAGGFYLKNINTFSAVNMLVDNSSSGSSVEFDNVQGTVNGIAIETDTVTAGSGLVRANIRIKNSPLTIGEIYITNSFYTAGSTDTTVQIYNDGGKVTLSALAIGSLNNLSSRKFTIYNKNGGVCEAINYVASGAYPYSLFPSTYVRRIGTYGSEISVAGSVTTFGKTTVAGNDSGRVVVTGGRVTGVLFRDSAGVTKSQVVADVKAGILNADFDSTFRIRRGANNDSAIMLSVNKLGKMQLPRYTGVANSDSVLVVNDTGMLVKRIDPFKNWNLEVDNPSAISSNPGAIVTQQRLDSAKEALIISAIQINDSTIQINQGGDSVFAFSIIGAGGSGVNTEQLYTGTGSVTIASGKTLLLYNNNTTSATITLPPPLYGGQEATIYFISGGSNVSIVSNAGQPIVQAFTPVVFDAGEHITYRWSSSVSKWLQ